MPSKNARKPNPINCREYAYLTLDEQQRFVDACRAAAKPRSALLRDLILAWLAETPPATKPPPKARHATQRLVVAIDSLAVAGNRVRNNLNQLTERARRGDVDMQPSAFSRVATQLGHLAKRAVTYLNAPKLPRQLDAMTLAATLREYTKVMNRVGERLNKLTHRAHAGGPPMTATDFADVLDQIARLTEHSLARIDEALA